ncbi:MAG: hypothetical protein QXX34_03575 [Candidatus Bathyarchaeia archaeon]
MELDIWREFIRKLQNIVNNICEDVFVDNDEIKAFGEIALLKMDLTRFLVEHYEGKRRARNE